MQTSTPNSTQTKASPGSASDKNPEKIRKMFGQVAKRYDLANTLLSGGIHHLWRNEVVKLSRAKSGDKILDCATGTGDLAIAFALKTGPNSEIVGTDFCSEMLDEAPAKAIASKVAIRFSVADAMDLPFPDNYFDIASISFGIRNVADPLKALSEMSRVVKPGGRVMVLEFGQVENPIFRRVYNFYSEVMLPKIGGLVTGTEDAYEYLQESSREFPCGQQFLDLMKQTNAFSSLHLKKLSLGISYIYCGRVG